MRTIQKTISLEPMTSRVPSVWPAYKDNKLYYFDDASLKEREYEYPSNYGLIPLSISFTHSFPSEEYEIGCGGDTLSFERISKMYAFFKRYYHLLNKAGHCGHIYSSATEYYDVESDSRYAYDLEYGMNRDTYIELDDTFESYGGDVFYNWLVENVIPTYTILKEYKEYWKVDTLYYPDVIRWIAWFNDRKYYETKANYTSATSIDVEHWDCKNSAVTDCCDCEEYFNRGGNRTLDSMKEWYNNVQSNITFLNSRIKLYFECFEPSIIDQIELQASSDDMGQYTNMSPEYELGIDYRTATYGDSANTHGGTTVIISGDTKILKHIPSVEMKGFCFSPYFMEKFYDEGQWDDYTMIYINDNPQEFVSSSYTYYAFDDEDRMYTGITSDDVISAMSSGDTYVIIPIDAILIDGALIQIEKSEYGIYENTNAYIGGRKYFVSREKETSTPYTIINGKKTYAETRIKPEGGISYYFPYLYEDDEITIKEFERTVDITIDTTNVITYILYDGQTYIVDESGVTINGIDYPRINGYAYDKNGDIIYVSGDTLFDFHFFEIPTSSATINENKMWVNVYNEDTIIYNARELTGRTLSKILDLALTHTLVDDVGIKINGLHKVPEIAKNRSVNHQPPAKTELEPIYQVGNTSLLGRFKLTSSNTNLDCNYYIGNIITDMIFYYKDISGEKVNETEVKCSGDTTALKAIKDSTNLKYSMENIVFDDDIYCDIKYYIGATLKRESGSKDYELAEGYNYGVEYNETVKFVKTLVQYTLRTETNRVIIPTEENEPSNHSIGYIIYTYELEQILEDVNSDIYKSIYKAPLANFKTEINLITSGETDSITTNFSKYSDMGEYNGINVSPQFREEYRLGMATMEKVDSDIYIDRGINAAFERHLKLGEVTSMEALLNYTNNYFKIIDS